LADSGSSNRTRATLARGGGVGGGAALGAGSGAALPAGNGSADVLGAGGDAATGCIEAAGGAIGLAAEELETAGHSAAGGGADPHAARSAHATAGRRIRRGFIAGTVP